MQRKKCYLNVLILSFLSDCKSETPEGQMGLMMENVVLFSQTLQQKLYSGAFLVDSQSLINFFADQIVGVRQTDKHTPHNYFPIVALDCENQPTGH